MTFRELKNGMNVFVLDKDAVKYSTARVINVSTPRYEQGVTGMVMDVTIDEGGRTSVYVMSENAETAYSGTKVIATDKAKLLTEVNLLQNQCEDILSNVEKSRETIDRCKAVRTELDTAYKEKQMTERRFADLENKIDQLLRIISKNETPAQL